MVTLVEGSLCPFRLPLSQPIATAHGTIRERRGALLRLVDDQGHAGTGEVAPLEGFGLEPLGEARPRIDALVASLRGRRFPDLDATLDAVDEATGDAPATRAAFDGALHDLFARREGRSLAALLADCEGRLPRETVPIAALVRASSPEAAAREARLAVRAGHRALKLKLTRESASLARATAVARSLPDDVELRLDANGSFSESEARAVLATLAPLGPAWVEQPIAPGDARALARVRDESPVPIAVDEGLARLDDARALAEARAADVWVVKPAVVGGLRAARRVARLAREARAEVVVSGFFDSAVGSAAALALAASLGSSRPAGLDPVLARDVAGLPPLAGGTRALPPGPGSGVVARSAA